MKKKLTIRKERHMAALEGKYIDCRAGLFQIIQKKKNKDVKSWSIRRSGFSGHSVTEG